MSSPDRVVDTQRRVAELIERGREREAAELAGAPIRIEPLPMDVRTQLDALGPALGAVVAQISAADLDRPTPCAAFTVRGVLAHMVQGATVFAAGFNGVEASPPDTSDVLTAFGPALGALVESINGPGALERTVPTPFGDLPGETFARFVVLDGIVHGWDLATATGQPYAPSDELVEAVEAFATGVLDPLRDGTTFADAQPAPASATPIERLAAFTGRRV